MGGTIKKFFYFLFFKVDKVLYVKRVTQTNGEHVMHGIVKFKGFKHAQQLPLETIKKNALSVNVKILFFFNFTLCFSIY